MDFIVLFGGAFVPLAIMLVMLHPQTPQRPRRFIWLLPLAVSNIFFALAHRSVGAGTIWWQYAGFASLMVGVVSYLFIPRSQR